MFYLLSLSCSLTRALHICTKQFAVAASTVTVAAWEPLKKIIWTSLEFCWGLAREKNGMAYHNNQICLDAIQPHGISLPCTCYCSCSGLDCAIYHCCSFACEHAQILMKMVIVIFILTVAVTAAPHGRCVLGTFNCNESFKSIDTEKCVSEVLNRKTDCMCERACVRACEGGSIQMWFSVKRKLQSASRCAHISFPANTISACVFPSVICFCEQSD